MRTNPDFDFRHLDAAARLQLAQDLWDSVAPEDADAEAPLTRGQEAELDRRLAELDEHPDAGVPWPQVHAELEAELAAMRRGPGGA